MIDKLLSFIRANWREWALVCVAVLPALAFIAWKRIHLEYWQDELVTLQEFAFYPVSEIVSSYHIPNNHIFFTLLLHLYTGVIGIGSPIAALQNPQALRIFVLLISSVGVWFTYLAGKALKNFYIGILAAVLLATAIPFLNFAVQIRGYGLTIALAAILLYLSIAWVKLDTGKWYAVGVVVVSALLIYTVPVNGYIIVTTGLLAGLIALRHVLQGQRKGWLANLFTTRYFQLSLLLLAGVILGIALFWPAYTDVSNAAADTDWPNYGTLTSELPELLISFLRDRLPMAIVFISAVAYSGIQVFAGNKQRWRETVLLAVMIVLPFILGFLTGRSSSGRTFLYVLPSLSLLVALSFEELVAFCASRFKAWDSKQLSQVLLALLIGTLYVGQFSGAARIDRQLADALVDGNKLQQVDKAFYVAHYQPSEAIAFAVQYSNENNVPMFKSFDKSLNDTETMYWYMAAIGAAEAELANPGWVEEWMTQHDEIVIITGLPNKFIERAYAERPYTYTVDFACDLLTTPLKFHGVISCRKT